eukprot:CAMPEP_0117020064 /NCGR_PEP_ID=MMETSP0472-20121206/15301_1 /TAXON_ID=693140 ORGANISM="Tiarina fusus, Strain LIS" /NCGR_SAMPLE_ID=MMETSP0472 /ASSEMBLY_ACC=CAM_ASM_000603 /LENGTH=410 /DNA_ID=CAMNT_0004725173 /DNA_START=126 /DNA_END=1355 /DNA_ORIENTATION=+
MAKKKNNSKKNQKRSTPKEEERITLEALDAMSSSDEEGIPEGQLNAKAKSLRQAISEGKFDHLVEKLKENAGDDDSEIEEVALDSDSDKEDEEEERADDGADADAKEEQVKDEKEEESEESDGQSDDNSEQEADEDEEDEKEEEEAPIGKSEQMEKNNHFNSKALSIVTAELVASHARLPWSETFDVIPPTALPFGKKVVDEDDEEEVVDIHDDLKREVAFYNIALEAVHESRKRCKTSDIPFSRPEDFFAEMVKTDDHMAKVKDKLIFETKKMDAVAQRKSNREQKLRAKESQANKVAEKAKRKKDHFKNVEDWANNAANNRGGALRDDLDDNYLNRTPGKKRQVADKKYGFGGKRGRFKQNDRATLNDVSGFNPRGNFAGAGTKKSAKGGAGAGRQGKRARDAKRARG